MKTRCQRLLLIMCLGLLLHLMAGCSEKTSEAQSPALTLFAATGTRAAVEELAGVWKTEYGTAPEVNFASSGTLARQIGAGAQPDVFISANRRWINYLLEKELLDSASVHVIASNALALIVPQESKLRPPEFTRNFPIASWTAGQGAVGDPAYVPVGRYTKAAWESLGWWEALQRNLILAKDVSSVLRYVELGEAEWGVVYRSEAMKSEKVKILQLVPQSLHKPIRFYVAELRSAKGNATAAKFRELVHSLKGAEVFLKHGFLEVPAENK